MPLCQPRNGRGSPGDGGDGSGLNGGSARDAAERVARESYAKLLAFVAARSGDFTAAEDALADAFTAALERWPRDGVPRSPQAWLLVAARHRLIDASRHDRRARPLADRLRLAAQDAQNAFERAEEVADERIGVLFACAHPSIPPSVHAPLMLQVALGLDAGRIASAFLVSPASMSQRLVRAKRKITAANVPLRVPGAEHFSERLDAVLAAIYTTFAQGWDDPAGIDPGARGLADEAIELGRLVVQTYPHESEALGLLALMLHADARRAARREGERYIPLDEQNPAHWNAPAIDEAEAVLARAARAQRIGRYQLEAAVQSAHAVRRHGREPDWLAIVTLYDALVRRTGSPVAALNRAVALRRAAGPGPALEALDAVGLDARMRSYQPYWAARAQLCAATGDTAGAREARERALGLTVDPSVRAYLAATLDS